MNKQLLYNAVEAKASVLTALSDEIWEYAELSMEENRSAAAHIAVLFHQQNFGAQFRSGIGRAEAGRAAAQNKYIGILRIFLNHDNLQKGNCASSLAAARRIVILKYCTLVPGLLTRYNEKIKFEKFFNFMQPETIFDDLYSVGA